MVEGDLSVYLWSIIMKNPLRHIQKYQHRIKQILGIGHKQFLNLVHLAEFKHKERLAFNERQKFRVNVPAGGRKAKLSILEQVCRCLFYSRQMPTFEVLGIHFNISKTQSSLFH